MKKVLLSLVLLFSLLSCKNEQEKLIYQCEDFLIKNLKDPNSYERIEAKITDTITSLEFATDNVMYFEESFKLVEGNEDSILYPTMLTCLQISNKVLDSVKKSKEPNKIREIIVEFKYRAKNSMGVLDIQKNGIEYLPDPTMFNKDKNDKFHLFEIKK